MFLFRDFSAFMQDQTGNLMKEGGGRKNQLMCTRAAMRLVLHHSFSAEGV